MISWFRNLSKSVIGIALSAIFLLAILAGFAMQDIRSIAGGSFGFDPGTLAKVGDSKVTERELSSFMQRRLNELRQQNPNADYSMMAGELPKILDSLIQNRALLEFAREHKMPISKRMIDAEILNLPGTKGLNGQFSEQAYATFLANQRLTDAQVRDAIASGLATRMLLAPATANPRIPVGVATPYASMLLEAREAEVGLVPIGLFAAGIPDPTDADIQAFYKENSARYMVPEQRVLSIARIGPAQVAKVVPSDQDIENYYKANQATYGGTESRNLTQAIAQSEPQARALAQKARGGALAGTSLKAVDKAKLANISGDAVANAVFNAKAGDVVGPIHSDLGWVVIKVDGVNAASGKPLSAVRGEIATKLTTDKRKQALAELTGKIEDSLADGASMDEAAKAAGLEIVKTPAITAGGISRSQPDFKLPPELAPAIKAGFDLGEGDEPVVEALPGDAGYALVGLDDIAAAAPAPLASIRDQVANDWKVKQAQNKARAVATAIADKTAKGTDMKAAIAATGIKLPPPQMVAKRRIELSAANGKVPPALAMMFSLAQGRSRMIADPGGRGFVIVKVTKIVPGNASLQPGLISRTQSDFQQAVPAEYAEEMGRAIQADVGVKRNDSAIADAKRRITGGGNE